MLKGDASFSQAYGRARKAMGYKDHASKARVHRKRGDASLGKDKVKGAKRPANKT